MFTKSILEHLEHVCAVLQHLHDKQLQANSTKYDFLHNSLRFLRHIALGRGVAPDPEKVDTIAKLSDPKDVYTLCLFLGCCSYYKCFIPRYALNSALLIDLLYTGAEWLWGPA